MRRCCGGLCALVLRLMVVTAAIGGLVATDARREVVPAEVASVAGFAPGSCASLAQ